MHIDKKLIILEKSNDWVKNIDFLKKNLNEISSSLDSSVMAIYFLMNLIVECDYENQGINSNEIIILLKDYFSRSFKNFKENPEYLFFLGIIAHMSEWYLGINDIDEAKNMLEKAMWKNPKNALYNWGYHAFKDMNSIEENAKAFPFSQLIISDINFKNYLRSKGKLGVYIYRLVNTWHTKNSKSLKKS